MECPILDGDGNRRTLQTIVFEDLTQLSEIGEGYIVEYKETLNDSVKKKLPKEITAFANAAGGWIFVGVTDEGHVTCIPCSKRTGYGQIIGQIIKRSISPQPRVDVRFIPNSDNECEGVLAIQVDEGLEPPYIANGEVFVRTGSSSESYNSPADSNMLIELFRKCRAFDSANDSFCRRTIYFPPSSVHEGVERFEHPLFNIYLRAIGTNGRFCIPASAVDERKHVMSAAFESVYNEKCICHPTHNSLQFRRRVMCPVDEGAPTIELFYDGSIKACVPIVRYQESDLDDAITRLSSIVRIKNTEIVRVMDGLASVSLLLNTCSVIDEYIHSEAKDITDFVVAYEFEQMQGMLVEFRNDGYAEYVRENGLMFVGAVDQKSRPYYFDKVDSNELREDVHGYMLLHFMEGCGVPFLTANEEAKRHILEIVVGKSLAKEIGDEMGNRHKPDSARRKALDR